MFGLLDIFGGSKRRSALLLFDRSLTQWEVNPAYVDDGMRFAIYKWADTYAQATASSVVIDDVMRAAAEMISYCVLGTAETEAQWGPALCAEREARFAAALAKDDDDSFDAMLIKLVLAKGIAAPDIRARVGLDMPDEKKSN